MNAIISYRADIDGLRALAVTAVILYHAEIGILTGGYVGVDIFFVISGFLITSLMLREFQAGQFEFSNFWMRRVRRILPASMFMMGCSALIFAIIFPPVLYREFGSSLVAQTFFSSNILFWKESGYFETAAELKPLLHTWSLAVEEQFYLFFPPLFWLLFRYARTHLWLAIFLMCTVSLAVSIRGANHDPDAAFFLLTSRAWELGIGALLALFPDRIYSKKLSVNNSISCIGIGAILYSMLTFDSQTPFPSWYALVPTLGTAAIIYGNRDRQSILKKFFSIRPIVSIGLISYSLYLWHWPIFVANRWLQIDEPSAISLLAATLLTLITASFSYFFVEEPIRRNRIVFTNQRLLYGSGTAFCILLGFGLAVYHSDGLPNRSEATRTLANDTSFIDDRGCTDFFTLGRDDFVCQSSAFSDFSGTPFFIWGDSHANAMIPSFESAATELKKRFYYATQSACPPILGVTRLDRPGDPCKDFNDAVLEYLLSEDIEIVFLIFRQNIYAQGRDINEQEYGDPVLSLVSGHASVTQDIDDTFQVFEKHLLDTLTLLRSNGIEVVIFRQLPEFLSNPAEVYPKYLMSGREVVGEHFMRELSAIEDRSERILDFFARNDIPYFDMTDIFCDNKYCHMIIDGKIMYRDDDHLGVWGAAMITPGITSLMQEIYAKSAANSGNTVVPDLLNTSGAY